MTEATESSERMRVVMDAPSSTMHLPNSGLEQVSAGNGTSSGSNSEVASEEPEAREHGAKLDKLTRGSKSEAKEESVEEDAKGGPSCDDSQRQAYTLDSTDDDAKGSDIEMQAESECSSGSEDKTGADTTRTRRAIEDKEGQPALAIRENAGRNRRSSTQRILDEDEARKLVAGLRRESQNLIAKI